MNKIKSNKEYRFKDNPEEQRFFENFIKDRYNLYGSISYICFGKDNQATDRDITVFLSAIQWLGSPVGQYFLKNVMNYKSDNNESKDNRSD